MQVNLDIIGKTLGEAATVMDDAEYSYRVVSRNGVARVVTCDFDMRRVNLTVVDGKITEYRFG